MASQRQLDLWARQLLPYIPVAPAPPENVYTLAGWAGLSSNQTRQAYAHLRDRIPAIPLVSTRQGYQRTMDREAVYPGRNRLVHPAGVQIDRAWRGIVRPYLRKAADPTTRRRVAKAYREAVAMIRNLEEMVLP